MSAHDIPSFYKRRHTRLIHVGSVPVGGDAAISVQTMTKTDTRDVDATVAQIHDVAQAGCDIVRVAVPDSVAAEALAEICRQSSIPVVADIHFDYRLALLAAESGVGGLRINPGNIGSREHVEAVVVAARERALPIRIGVNGGSLEDDICTKHGGSTPAALVESALRHVAILEDLDFNDIKISVKASDVWRTVQAYRLLSHESDYPLHLGVTEAGTFVSGTVRSSVAMGMLLSEGIGDTIRVSLTDTPVREVQVGLELLRSLELRAPGPRVTSCPTCGRCQVDIMSVSGEVEQALEAYYQKHPEAPRPLVAVMGCMVNGPGEAREADIAIAGGKGKFALYVRGQHRRTVSEAEAVNALMEEVHHWKKP
ncbi:MAG: flavodoxin-dependent (E)-4-hydroxy-3-methylbut-2-enyl-diphosphate synthase [Kiritimatiellae bacterium]|nr:flavodoxin-dependent (E)-4-hydroxy-3-methylbut-2-enyl-diphosphate synthase [Kiritimatiellia bacterium]